MVTDRLVNTGLYRSLGPRIAAALDYVAATDFAAIPNGRHDVDGDRIFALVQRFVPKPLCEGRWEAHRKYIDLQCVLSGAEQIGYVSIDQLKAEPYDAERDLMWLTGTSGQWVTVPAGHFMMLWPGDAHMPSIAAGTPQPVVKVVLKIAVG